MKLVTLASALRRFGFIGRASAERWDLIELTTSVENSALALQVQAK